MSFSWGHWYPYFGLLVMSPLGFKSQSGQTYSYLAETYMLHVPWDSPLVQHLLTSSMYIPVSQHCWSMKLGSIMTLLPHSVRSGRCSAQSLLVYLQVMNGEYKEPSTHSSEGAMHVEFLESINWKLQYKRDMQFNSGLTSNSLIASHQLYFYCVYIM